MNEGADLVSKSILDKESKTIIVNGKPYFLKPPTIKKIAGAGLAMSGMDYEGNTVGDLLHAMQDTAKAAKALSWFINGDESLADELSNGTLDQIVGGIAEAVKMLGIEDFRKLSDLSRSVRRLIANPK